MERLRQAGPSHFDELLRSGATVLLDGGWATELFARGLPSHTPSDAANLDLAHGSRIVAALADAYVAAGGRILLTNTFNANRLRLAAYALAGQTVEINSAGARIALEAASAAADTTRSAFVFGSMGPAAPMGGGTPPRFRLAAYREQGAALIDAGCDGLALETMSLNEALVALDAIASLGWPVVASLVYGARGLTNRTLEGESPERAAGALERAGATILGANCTEPAHIVEVCRRLRAATRLPLWMKPNAGLPALSSGRAVYRMTPQKFAALGQELIAAGADLVGGCCGIGPDHVAALHRALNQPAA